MRTSPKISVSPVQMGGGGVETLLKPFCGERSRTVKTVKTALLLFFILFSGSSLMKTYSQGLVQANGNDIAYTMRRFGVKMNNPALPFEVNGSGRFYKNLYVDSLVKAWKVEAFSAELNSLKVTAGITANTLQISSTVILDILSASGNGIVAVDASGTLKRYDLTGHSTDVFLGDGTFGNLGSITGWQWYGTDLVSNAQRVVIQRDLAVGGHISVGVTKIISNGSNIDTMRTPKELQIISDAGRIEMRADTVRMKDLLEAPRMRTPLLTVTGDASVSGTVNSGEVNTTLLTATELTSDSLTVNNSIKVKRILPLPGDSIIRIGQNSINILDPLNRIFSSTSLFISLKGISLGNYRNPNYAPSVGWQQFSAANAFAEGSLAFGFLVGTEQSAKNAIVIGSGDSIYANGSLINNKPNSLMVGFNSNIPSLYVEPSTGIGTTGNIGIGTTTPEAKLHVSSTDIANPAQIGLGVNGGSGGYTYLGIGLSAVMGGYSALQSIKSAGTAWGDLILNPSGGKVGIGTTDPQSLLHVRIQGYPSSSFAESQGALFKVQQSSTPDWAAEIYNNGGSGKGLRILADGGTSVPLLQVDDATVGGSTRFVVLGNGKVGIGTSPGAKLHVVADANEFGLIVATNYGANYGYGIQSKVTGENTKAFAVENNNVETFKVMGNGNLYATRIWTSIPSLFPDHVFDKTYNRPTHIEKEEYFKNYHKMMYMPSAEEVAKNGLDISGTIVGLTQNTEENSLDINDIFKRLIKIEKDNAEKDKKIERLEKEVEELRKLKK